MIQEQNLFDHQIKAVDELYKRKNVLLLRAMGSGKTAIALHLCKKLLNNSNAFILKYLFKIFILFLLFTGYINAQNVTKWTINPFENKAFIENKGQYIEEEKKLGEDIYFGVLKDGMEIYFCKNKVVYKHTTVIPLTE